MKNISSVVLGGLLSILLLMSLSFQVYAVVDEDDVGESFTGIGYYFPNRLNNGAGGHSDEDGEGALINNITVTYLVSP